MPGSDNHRAVTSSVNPNWRTPRWLVEALDREFGIIMDCAADASCTVTPAFLGPGSPLLDDALLPVPWWDIAIQAWSDNPHIVRRDALFCNPPYSQRAKMPIGPWVARMAIEGQRGTVLGVLPFSPQTRWWRQYVEGDLYRVHELRRFPFRLRFDPPPDYHGDAPGANVNTVVAIWKPSHAFVGPWAPQSRYWTPTTLDPTAILDDAEDAGGGGDAAPGAAAESLDRATGQADPRTA